MKTLRIIRSTAIASSLLATALIGGTAAATPNTSSYSMQQSGSTINVYETNSEAVNAVEADFAYTGAPGSFTITPGIGSTFTTCLSQTSSSVSCTILGGSASAGTHLVATLSFAPNAGISAASVTVSMTSGSQVLATADSTDTLNHATLPSSTYAYVAPAAPAPSAPAASNPGSSSNTTKTAATGSKATTSTGTAAAPASDTPAVAATDTKAKAAPKVTEQAAASQTIKTHHTGLVTSSLSVLLIVLAAAYWLVVRKRPEAVPAKVYKLNTTAGAASKTKTKKAPAKAAAARTKATAARKPVAKKTAAKKKA